MNHYLHNVSAEQPAGDTIRYNVRSCSTKDKIELSATMLCCDGAHITKKVAVLTSILCVVDAENQFSAL